MHCLTRAEERLAAWRAPQTEILLVAAEPRARHIASQLLAAFCAGHPGVQGRLHIAERAQLVERFGACKDDVYLFELPLEGSPEQSRWTVAHAKGRDLAQSAAQFLREALAADRNDGELSREETGLPLRPTTRR
jgi:hypothetical protein